MRNNLLNEQTNKKKITTTINNYRWGTRPYDKKINPAENIVVSIAAMGEGWHNYHHVFPWDYKAAELAHRFNITTFWIQLFSKIGWAYDLKEPSAELVRKTIAKCGKTKCQIIAFNLFVVRTK